MHDAGLVRFLEEAWTAVERQRIDRDFLVADTYPTRGLFQGMSEELVAARPGAGGHRRSRRLVGPRLVESDRRGHLRGGALVGRRRADRGGSRARRRDGGLRLCRPPGHHAAAAMAGGYCFFNNAAIAAQAIAEATGDRVAILDVDVHHGNGTQQIFWRREDVLYASLHADPRRLYPFYLGHADEVGEGRARAPT